LAGLALDANGLEGRATEEIVRALGGLGIDVGEEGFRELAATHGKVEAIAEF